MIDQLNARDEGTTKPRKRKDNIKNPTETEREQNEIATFRQGINDFRKTESFKIITGITGKKDVVYEDLKEILDLTIKFCSGIDAKTKRVLKRDKTAAFVYLDDLLINNYDKTYFILRHAILSYD